MGIIQNDIAQIKNQATNQDLSRDNERLNELEIENRVLKSQVQELETRATTSKTNIQSTMGNLETIASQNNRASLVSEPNKETAEEMQLKFQKQLLQLQKENIEKEKFFVEMRQKEAENEQRLG